MRGGGGVCFGIEKPPPPGKTSEVLNLADRRYWIVNQYDEWRFLTNTMLRKETCSRYIGCGEA